MVNPHKKKPLPPRTDGKTLVDDCFRPRTWKNYDHMVQMQEQICKKVYKCTPLLTAFRSCGLLRDTYYKWKNHYEEEKALYEGTDKTTWMIDFFDPIIEASCNNESVLAEVVFDKAVNDGDLDAVKYALDKLHKWKETKQVEVATEEDKSISININPMEDNYKEKEETDDD